MKHKYEKFKREGEDEKKSNPKLEDLLFRREGENEQVIILFIKYIASWWYNTTETESRVNHKAKRQVRNFFERILEQIPRSWGTKRTISK